MIVVQKDELQNRAYYDRDARLVVDVHVQKFQISTHEIFKLVNFIISQINRVSAPRSQHEIKYRVKENRHIDQ